MHLAEFPILRVFEGLSPLSYLFGNVLSFNNVYTISESGLFSIYAVFGFFLVVPLLPCCIKCWDLVFFGPFRIFYNL